MTTANATLPTALATLTLCQRDTRGLSWTQARRERNKKTRVYGALNTFAQDHLDNEPSRGEHLYTEKIQPGLWAEMSDAEREEMTKKVGIWKAWKRAALKPARLGSLDAIHELLAEGTHTFEPHTEGTPMRMSFSEKAGCSCPCSPGFILNGRVLDSDGKGIDIWVDTKSE